MRSPDGRDVRQPQTFQLPHIPIYVVDLVRDAYRYFEDLNAHLDRALSHIAIPSALKEDSSGWVA
jgi:hypothetical protein